MRIVSLSPALTELIHELGRGDALVGVDRHSDTPPSARRLPRVGTITEPDVEAIRALQPDLVVVFDLVPGGPDAAAALEGSGLPVEVLSAVRLGDVGALFCDLGQRLGRARRGAELSAALQGRLDAVASRLRPLSRPVVYVELWPDPPLALGTASWIHDLLVLAGGRNAFDDVEAPNRRVDAATVGARRPDAALLTWGSARSVTAVGRRPGWQAVEAFRRGRVASIAVDALKRPVPRLADGFEILVERLREATTAAGRLGD